MTYTFTAIFQEAEEGGYAAWVEELPGAISQGDTLDETRENLKKAIALIVESNRERANDNVGATGVIRELIVVDK